MINYYKIQIKGKNVYRLFNKIIQAKINIFDVIYKKDCIIFKTSYEEYLKIIKINTIYEISIIDIKGKKKVKKLAGFYKMYLIFFAISLLLILLYSVVIIRIDIDTDNKELKEIITKELKNNNITIYTIAKSFNKLETIANNIRSNNKNLIDWIEIKKLGITYQVTVIEKITNNNNSELNKNNIIAAKNGMILDMYIKNGQIIKNQGDYVAKGETIVSGYITKNEEIKNIVNADGKVFAETWYKVKISHPKALKEQVNKKGYSEIKITCFGKEFVIMKLNIKNLKKESIINLFNNNLFKLTIEKKYKENLIQKNYNSKELILKMENLAKEKIESELIEKEKILLQKTLKIDAYDDRIYIEVFFKVYEDIAEKQEILN